MPVIGAGAEDKNFQPAEITWTCVHVFPFSQRHQQTSLQ
jgi:hypothetical protein